MNIDIIDLLTFVGFLALVIGVSIYASRKEDSEEDYFLAGRGLTWWVIGLSLIASNISTEHFVGMAGKGFTEVGLAIASYEWIAAYTLVFVALFFLPRFLRAGIYTIPEFLEYRYNQLARSIMAGFMLLFYVGVTIAVVLSAGAKLLNTLFDLSAIQGVWLLGILAGVYTVYGGLKAVVWSDVIQGTALMLGGLLVTCLGFLAFADLDPTATYAGGFDKLMHGIGLFMERSQDRLHTILPADDKELPWPAVLIGGMWIPNIFYWGLNQFITQRTLAAKNLLEGQKGILFGASLKLIIPFIIVFPGIMAFELYGDEIMSLYAGAEGNPADHAFPYLFKQLLPVGLVGVMLAALFGATMSTLDSLLNSAATIFTMDIYKPFINKTASHKQQVRVGRITTLILTIAACIWAPIVGGFEEGLFNFIQKFWGFIQPGLVAVFFMGILWKRVPPFAAVAGILFNIPVYGFLLYMYPDVAFLHHMGITFVAVIALVSILTFIKPYQQEIVYPQRMEVSLKPQPVVIIWSIAVIVATTALYIIFA